MRVFISHSSKDKPTVEALERGLRERGMLTTPCSEAINFRT
jgi:hypothetical protein